MADSVSLSERWRDVAWTAHEGEGLDLEQTADAVARLVLEAVLASLTENEYGRTEAYEETVQMVRGLLDG